MNRRKFIGLSSVLLSANLYADKISYLNKGLSILQAEDFPAFNLSKIPFSYIGSFHVINQTESKKTLKLNTARRSAIPFKWLKGWAFDAYEISFCRGEEEIPFEVKSTPWRLELTAKDSSASILFYDKDTLAVFTHNCSLKLIPAREYAWKYPRHKGITLFDNQTQQYTNIYAYNNSSIKTDQQKEKGQDGKEEIRDVIRFEENGSILLQIVTEELTFDPQQKTEETLLSARKKEVDTWMSKMPLAKKEHLNAAKVGWFLFWNLQIAPEGNYTRQSILSSKKSMNMIWSWDICFNALTVVKADHQLAWDQLFAILDKQKESGLLPDSVNDLMDTYGFNKPPVWGWTAMKMLENTPKADWKRYLNEFYPKIVKFTDWWYANRDFNKNGICEYAHGNDSGWDNATVFDSRLPTESPDLTCYLILQAEALSFIATYLGRSEDAKKWSKLAESQLKLFHQTFPENNELIYQVVTDKGTEKRRSTSLLTRIPILLGEKLDAHIRRSIVEELKQENLFLTKNGLASEAVNSPAYEANGYWRGPVWAPSTYLIFDGLLKCGEKELARTIAQRFCDMVSKEATFNENYNALTGEGQFDSGLTWTASDFLMLADWLARN